MEARTEALLKKLSLFNCLRMLAGRRGLPALTPWTYRLSLYCSPGNRKLSIPGIRFVDGPRGIHKGRSTAFPATIARGAAWDPVLEEAVGRAMGLEARARGANACGACCVNLVRHPAGGRSQESYGADPHLAGALGSALVRGLSTHVMPVVKHFALNNIENTRFRVNVKAGERTLREVFLPHFRDCVRAGAAGVMTAYNQVNGHYCGENETLIKRILKQEWGFDGFVVSDFFLGCRSTARSLNAGLDLEMPQAFFYSLPALLFAVRSGRISRERIRDAARRLVRQQVRAGFVEPEKESRPMVDHPAHRRLALEAAQKSLVLLRNRDNALPLDRRRVRTVAVIGEAAKSPLLGSPGSAGVLPDYAVTPHQGLKSRFSDAELLFSKGSGYQAPRAEKLAKNADVTVVFAGIRPRDEGEYFPFLGGGDRKRLSLSPDQERLIERVGRAAKKLVVVLTGGSAIVPGPWERYADAVVMAWYGGMEAGAAIADVLAGNVNPSGKLPLSFPAHAEEPFSWDDGPDEVEYGYWHDYRALDQMGKKPWFPFGHGLSYTSFEYRKLEVETPVILVDGELVFSMEVENAGLRAGEEVVQVYVGYAGSRVSPRSVKELKAFKRVVLAPGEARRVEFRIPAESLAYYDEKEGAFAVEPMAYELLLGSSSADIRLSGSFAVSG